LYNIYYNTYRRSVLCFAGNNTSGSQSSSKNANNDVKKQNRKHRTEHPRENMTTTRRCTRGDVGARGNASNAINHRRRPSVAIGTSRYCVGHSLTGPSEEFDPAVVVFWLQPSVFLTWQINRRPVPIYTRNGYGVYYLCNIIIIVNRCRTRP